MNRTTLIATSFVVGAALDVAFNVALRDRRFEPGPWRGLQQFYEQTHPATAALGAGVLFAGVTAVATLPQRGCP